MQGHIYKILLYLLRSLIYIKRAVLWLFFLLLSILKKLGQLFRNTIGFRFYKIKFSLQRYIGKAKIPYENRLLEFFGKRNTLQIVLLIVIFIIMLPHTKLYTKDITKIPGRDTILYKIVSPSYQDFELEEVTVDFTKPSTKNTNTWKQGAVIAQQHNLDNNLTIPTQTEITGISAGGTALTKPNIISGGILPTGTSDTGRTEIVYHTVEAGETIGGIAQKYNISLTSILWANDLSIRSYIRPGDKLKILPVSGLVHKIKSGDTISKIAKTYQSDAEKIIKYNKLQKDGADIVVGEELLIPDGVKPQPVYTYTPPVRQYTQLSNISAPPPSADAPAGSGYLWPTSVRHITQYYGWVHTGLDIAGPVGTPLYASRSGNVIKSQCGYNGGYGCYIILDHGGGIQTLYGHASKLLVSVGDQVTQGQTIALMGSTGRSTGSHIHFEVRVNGARLNPLKYIR